MNTSVDEQTINYYRQHAPEIAEKYRNAADGVTAFYQQAFTPGSGILDVGCGSGRDLHKLSELGFDVTGVDPAQEMLREALRLHPDLNGRLHTGSLPSLSEFDDKSFDGVLCSAVLMHIPGRYLFDSVWELKRLLKPGGTMLISLPVVETIKGIRDDKGRLFSSLLPDKLQLPLERIGFQEVNRRQNDDSLGRPDRKWITQIYRLTSETGKWSIDRIESILNRDNKVATYKLALFRALADLAQTSCNLAVWRGDGKVLVPIQSVAEKWIEYFWPVIEYPDQRIPQTTGRSIAFRSLFEDMIEGYRNEGGGLARYALDYRSRSIPSDINKIHTRLLSKLKHTIWSQPVRYAGGGEDFSVMEYDKVGKNIVLGADMWRELSLTGSWIKDATILRWAELTQKISHNSVRASTVIDLLLTNPLPERDVGAVRTIYDGLHQKYCVWSDKSLGSSYDIDHAIPYSLWHNNDLWNLLPANSQANNSKRTNSPQGIWFSVARMQSFTTGIYCMSHIRTVSYMKYDSSAARTRRPIGKIASFNVSPRRLR